MLRKDEERMSAEVIRDLEFMKNIYEWPWFPFLPVKRTVELEEKNTGVVITNGLVPIPVVYLINLFSIDKNMDFETVEKIKYNSIEELSVEWGVD